MAVSSASAQPPSQPPGKNDPYHGAPPPTPELGRLVRMRVLKPSELPAHPEMAPRQSPGSPPELGSFLSDALAEAEVFMTDYLPRTFKVKNSGKQSPPSAASVELLSHEINAADIPVQVRTAPAGSTAETWFARTSTHENAANDGTASWAEFDGGLRVDHSQHERAYTPDVYDAHEVLNWESELASTQRKVGSWEDVNMSIMEMVHHIPPPLNDRVFPELVVTAKKAEEFIVIQIPVDTTGIASAKYNSKNGKMTTGMYCSIERGEVVDGGAKVKWQMATASDAKGALPMWAQKMGVPGAVVKDVGLFIGWCAKNRQGKA